MTELRDIGYYTIDEAYITRYDRSGDRYNIANYIASMSFTESIYSPVIMGSILISDSTNIVDNFPIRGEEILTLSYSDFYNNQITQDFMVYSITSIGPSTQQNSLGYLLSFVSPQSIMSAAADIQKSYKGTTTEIINKIFSEYLTERQRFDNARYTIDTEESTGVQTIVIPMLSPLEAIDFLKRRSFSAENKSSNYLFFQNREKFRMVTHEKLIKDSKRGVDFDPRKIYTHDPGMIIDSITADRVMNNILDINFPNRINTLEEIQYGAMTSVTVEVDILQKQYRLFDYDYKDNYKKYTHLDQVSEFSHTDAFIEKYFSNKVVSDMISSDLERPNQRYKDIIPHRRSSSYYLNNGITCDIEVYGRNDLFAGDIIRLNLPEYEVTNNDKSQHKSLSGYWLVNQIIHKLEDKEYKCEVNLTKDLPRGGEVIN